MIVIGEHDEDIASSDAAAAFTTAEEKMKLCFTAYNVSLLLLFF